MSFENIPKKEIVLISAAAVAAGIGGAALRYIMKRKKENKIIFVEGISDEAAVIFGVISTAENNQRVRDLAVEIYDGEPEEESK